MRKAVGKLRHLITIQSNAETINDFGQYLDVWTDVATVYASKDYDAGGERIKADQLDSTTLFKFVIRHRTDVLASQRILLNSEYFTIQQVHDVDGDKKYLVLKTTLERDGAQST